VEVNKHYQHLPFQTKQAQEEGHQLFTMKGLALTLNKWFKRKW